MKFFVAVVILALAVSAQAGLLPWGYSTATYGGHGVWAASPYGYAAHDNGQYVHDPSGDHDWSDHGYAHGPVAYAHGPVAYAHGPVAYAHAPVSYAAHSAVVHAVPAVHAVPVLHHAVPVAHEGSYVAATRGSVHTAPLPGHVHSASAINTAPAPGTW